MTGSQGVAAERTGPARQAREAHLRVALHTRVRGTALHVVAHERADHVRGEGLLGVDDVVGKAEPRGHAARRLDGAAMVAGFAIYTAASRSPIRPG